MNVLFCLLRQPPGGDHPRAHHGLGRASACAAHGQDRHGLLLGGAIVSNTPLRHLLDNEDRTNTLVIQVDLFSARGELPRAMEDVLGRHKDIMYSSRTRHNTDMFRRLREWTRRLQMVLAKVPEDALTDEDRKLRNELAELSDMTILQLIYQQKAYEGHAKDYDFSGTSMREHWQSGYEDTRRTLKQRRWLEMPARGAASRCTTCTACRRTDGGSHSHARL